MIFVLFGTCKQFLSFHRVEAGKIKENVCFGSLPFYNTAYAQCSNPNF